MRLPSATPDVREMLRSMSIVSDGAENFVSADDYLQPQVDQQAAADKQPLHNVRQSLDVFVYTPSWQFSPTIRPARRSLIRDST